MTFQHGLGRRFAPDARDRAYPLRAALVHPQLPPRPRQRPYNLGPTLDQGDTSQCVAYACRDKLAAAPFMVHEDQGPTTLAIYQGAQALDEWSGPPPPYDGTSVRAGFKFLQGLGYLASYVWATSVEEIEAFVRGGYGTIVLGTNWYGDMFQPDAHGLVSIGGPVVGGHAYHCFWADPSVREVWCKNSWGVNWGTTLHARRGCFRLRYADLDRLLQEDGEAGAGLELKVKA